MWQEQRNSRTIVNKQIPTWKRLIIMAIVSPLVRKFINWQFKANWGISWCGRLVIDKEILKQLNSNDHKINHILINSGKGMQESYWISEIKEKYIYDCFVT